MVFRDCAGIMKSQVSLSLLGTSRLYQILIVAGSRWKLDNTTFWTRVVSPGDTVTLFLCFCLFVKYLNFVEDTQSLAVPVSVINVLLLSAGSCTSAFTFRMCSVFGAAAVRWTTLTLAASDAKFEKYFLSDQAQIFSRIIDAGERLLSWNIRKK